MICFELLSDKSRLEVENYKIFLSYFEFFSFESFVVEKLYNSELSSDKILILFGLLPL